MEKLFTARGQAQHRAKHVDVKNHIEVKVEDRPYLQIPLPSDEDFIRFKEWQKKKQQEEEAESDDHGHIIIVDI